MDNTLIPSGGFCYRVVKIQDGEIMRDDREAFGRTLREFTYHAPYKAVLCPYWQRTAYGTVRCEFLNREYIDDERANAIAEMIAYFGDPNAPSRFQHSWALPDEIKICGEREDEDTEWID